MAPGVRFHRFTLVERSPDPEWLGSLRYVRRALPPLITLLLLLCLAAPAQAVTMRTTNFVAYFEGFLSCPYDDPAGHATIGYGHLLHYGSVTKKDKRKWGCITEEEGLKLLRKDLKATEEEVLERIEGATVTPTMVTALTSFAFNLGAAALDPRHTQGQPRGTAIARKMIKGRYYRAGKDMLLYDGIIVNGKRYELEGLQIRRRREYRLLVKDIDEIESCGEACVTGSAGGKSAGGKAPNGKSRPSGGVTIAGSVLPG